MFFHIFYFWTHIILFLASLHRPIWLQAGNLSSNIKLNTKRNKHQEKQQSITHSIRRNMKSVKCDGTWLATQVGIEPTFVTHPEVWPEIRRLSQRVITLTIGIRSQLSQPSSWVSNLSSCSLTTRGFVNVIQGTKQILKSRSDPCVFFAEHSWSYRQAVEVRSITWIMSAIP